MRAIRSPRGIDRERLARTLTFWLRPYFLLRVGNRFQRIVGFDRAIALASSVLTAVIPLAMLISAISSQLGGKSTADRIVERYELSGGGAKAVEDLFSPAGGEQTSVGVAGVLFLLLAVLSFTRGAQRLFEQTWELKPLSVRNSLNNALWAGGLVVFLAVTGTIHGELGHGRLELAATLVAFPVTAAFLLWSGRLLSAKRLEREQLMAFAILGAVLLSAYSIGAAVYLPHLFSTYATRYGVIGAVFAMISALFCAMCVLVGSAAAGREVHDELENIRAGRRPPDDEVRRQWDEMLVLARSRWETSRVRLHRRRRPDDERPGAPGPLEE